MRIRRAVTTLALAATLTVGAAASMATAAPAVSA